MSEEPKELTEDEEMVLDDSSDELADDLEGELVEVTTSDIASGTPGSAAHCPVALAVRRVIRRRGHSVVRVTVNGSRIACKVGSLPTMHFALPLDVQRWIRRFDEFKYFGPISFTLETFVRRLRRMSGKKRVLKRRRRSVYAWAS